MRRPKAIFFDMDGVLVDSEALHWESVLEVLKIHLGNEAPLLPQRIGWGDEDLWKELADQYALKGDSKSLTQERGRLAMISLAAHPPPRMLGALEAILKWRAHQPELILAVVSASPKDQMQESLKSFTDEKGDSVFDALFSGVDDVSNNKPAPDAYLAAMRHFKLSPEECWIAEDSSTGLSAALASGAKVYAIGAEHAEPQLRARCQSEMNTLLALYDLWLTLNQTADNLAL